MPLATDGDGRTGHGRANPVNRLIQWDWRLPDDAPFEQRKELYAAERATACSTACEDSAPADRRSNLEQAVAERRGSAPAAVILLRELGVIQEKDAEVYHDLRRNSFVDGRAVDPATAKISCTCRARLHRLETEKLDDEMLLKLL